MASARAPKQRVLTTNETLTSFEAWKANLLYILTLDNAFAPYLETSWTKTSVDTNRGLKDDSVENVFAKTAAQKKIQLELMLGMIANYAPIISRNSIIKQSTSLSSVWQMIKTHYHFQSTGSQFLDFCTIRRLPEERPEDLYQRLHTFVENGLLTRESGITHHDDPPLVDEELSPTLESMIVLRWLELINKDLPRLVQQRYCTELRSRTLPSIRHEISLAINSLLDEINLTVETRALTMGDRFKPRQARTTMHRKSPVCPICKHANRPSNHYLSKCTLLPDTDKKFLFRARALEMHEDSPDEHSDDSHDFDPQEITQSVSTIRVSRIEVESCPNLDVFYGGKATRLTLDTGCTGNIIRLDVAQELGIPIRPTKQRAVQADGATPLDVIGEVAVKFHRDHHELSFLGLVSRTLDVPILAGTPFQSSNDVYARPNRKVVYIKESAYPYITNAEKIQQVRLCTFDTLRSPQKASIFPGEYLELPLPSSFHGSTEVAIEPLSEWLKHDISDIVGNSVRLKNHSSDIHVVKKHDHVCHVRPVIHLDNSPDAAAVLETPTLVASPKVRTTCHSQSISVDPDKVLSPAQRTEFSELHTSFDDVFGQVTTGYNGAFGPIEAVVNMGPTLPPQRRGRLPLYPAKNLQTLQDNLDILESKGILAKPDDFGINVEYVNPTFLVKKSNDTFRTVTAFADIGRFAKPTPSLMPDVESTLRTIAQWNYIICTDMSMAYFQIPLSKDSMKYCGVATPFRGVRIYTRSAMGMPGSEAALEEIMSRVLGSCMLEGYTAKVADDLYIGGDTVEELLQHWQTVLSHLSQANIKLSPTKTVICPTKTVILGWLWEKGTLSSTSHRRSALSSCEPPATVKGLRSYIGAYKALSRVIPGSAQFIIPLDDVAAGRESKEKIMWTDSLIHSFKAAQDHLQQAKTITLPRTDDRLWLVTDGAVKYPGVGATLYVERDNHLLPSGFFSAKLKKHQITWLPCEIESLAIASATKFFGPYLVQSSHKTVCLTDSKPCVQAFDKLCRGEFSSSPRVSTMLSTASRFHISIRHLAGFKNLVADFESRNVPLCVNDSCQVCSFVDRLQEISVCDINITDILEHRSNLPYVSRKAWLQIQRECENVSTAVAYLTNGTRPNKKLTKMSDTKRYLRFCSVATDGLLVVKQETSLLGPRETIVVPRSSADGLLTALHIKLKHPSAHQLKQVIARFFYILDIKGVVDNVTQSCHECASLRSFPKHQQEQSTSEPAAGVGRRLAADVIKRAQQNILLVRETVTSFTSSTFLDAETADCARQGLLLLTLNLIPLDGPPSVIRTDPAPCFQSLVHDQQLALHNIVIEIGNHKNQNKNPIAERAVQELEEEIKRVSPGGSQITPTQLASATATLNSRLRSRGLSAREMLYMRDQHSFAQIKSVTDDFLIEDQHQSRISNHEQSMRSKNPRAQPRMAPLLKKGDIVYLVDERSKHNVRDRYIVSSLDGEWCNIQKFAGLSLMKRNYRVKRSSCYLVPAHVPPTQSLTANASDDSDNDSVLSDLEADQRHAELGAQQPVELQHPPEPQPLSQPHSQLTSQPQAASENHISPIETSPLCTPMEPTTQKSPRTVHTPVHPRRSTRPRRPNTRYKDFVRH